MNTPTPSCFELSCTECDARYAKLTAERDQLHAELERTDAIYQRACEVEHELRAELATERARLDYLLQWDVTFHDRADIDAEIGYAQRKKSVPTLP